MQESMRRLEARPISAADFAPFGDVLGVPLGAPLDAPFEGRAAALASQLGQGAAINDATGQRFDHPATLDLGRFGGAPLLALFKTEGDAHRAPFRLRAFERHQHGSQSFAPLGQSRCLVIVARGEASPDLSSVQAFMVEPGQIVTIRASVWHHPLLSIGPATVLVLERGAASTDCDIAPITDAIEVTLPLAER